MTAAFQWNPDSALLAKVMQLAQQRGQSPEVILSEAVTLYVENMETQEIEPDPAAMNVENDPLIGLFSGSSDLAARSEDILQQEIKGRSGWTWK